MKTALRASLCCALLHILTPPAALAQDGREPPSSGLSAIPFRFGPPGARSLGLGGAFIALADDATASEANPAGLTLLFRPEVSIHGRSTSTDLEVVDLNAAAALDNLNGFRTDFVGMPPLRGGDRVGNAFADSPRTTLRIQFRFRPIRLPSVATRSAAANSAVLCLCELTEEQWEPYRDCEHDFPEILVSKSEEVPGSR